MDRHAKRRASQEDGDGLNTYGVSGLPADDFMLKTYLSMRSSALEAAVYRLLSAVE